MASYNPGERTEESLEWSRGKECFTCWPMVLSCLKALHHRKYASTLMACLGKKKTTQIQPIPDNFAVYLRCTGRLQNYLESAGLHEFSKLRHFCIWWIALINNTQNQPTLTRKIMQTRPVAYAYGLGLYWGERSLKGSPQLEHLECISLMLSNLVAIQQSFYAMIISTDEVFSISLGFLRHLLTSENF